MAARHDADQSASPQDRTSKGARRWSSWFMKMRADCSRLRNTATNHFAQLNNVRSMAIDTFPQPVVTSDVNTDKNEHAVFIGSCDGVVVLPASELPNYYDGYRTVMLLAILLIALAVPILLFAEFLQ